MKDKKNQAVKSEEGKVFFDTNILVYSIDERDPRKQKIASKILNDASIEQRGIISTQSLQEFYKIYYHIVL